MPQLLLSSRGVSQNLTSGEFLNKQAYLHFYSDCLHIFFRTEINQVELIYLYMMLKFKRNMQIFQYSEPFLQGNPVLGIFWVFGFRIRDVGAYTFLHFQTFILHFQTFVIHFYIFKLLFYICNFA